MAEIEFSEKETEDIEGLAKRLDQYGFPERGQILSNVRFRRDDFRELILKALGKAGLKGNVIIAARYPSKEELSKGSGYPDGVEFPFTDPCSTC